VQSMTQCQTELHWLWCVDCCGVLKVHNTLRCVCMLLAFLLIVKIMFPAVPWQPHTVTQCIMWKHWCLLTCQRLRTHRLIVARFACKICTNRKGHTAMYILMPFLYCLHPCPVLAEPRLLVTGRRSLWIRPQIFGLAPSALMMGAAADKMI